MFSAKVINAEMVTPVTIGDGVKDLENQSLTTEKREDISRDLAGIGLLGLWLIGLGSSVGRAETGKTSGTDGSQKRQPAIACAVESLPTEVVEEAPFEVTVSWSLPASSGQVRLNCELKGEGIDVLQAQRPMVAGTGRQQLRFTALRRSQSQHIVLACWLGTDWRQPLVTDPLRQTDHHHLAGGRREAPTR